MTCQTPKCTNKPQKYRKFCPKCRYRTWAKKNPLRAGFINLRKRAKSRGKEFYLTFEQYKSFAIKTNYHINKGRSANSYHIDRIDENGPYSIDNIQVLTNSQNIRKFVQFKQRNEKNEVEFETVTVKKTSQRDENNCPF